MVGNWENVKARYLSDLQDRNHNVLENRSAAHAHPSSAIDDLTPGKDISMYRRAGQYYSMHYAGNNTGVGSFAARLFAIPFIVVNAFRINSIALEITTGGGAGSKTRLGIYVDDGTVYPGSLLIDVGITDNSGTGVKELSISPVQSLTNGLYWITGALDGNGNFRIINNPVNMLGSNAGNFGYAGVAYSKTGVYTAALPSIFPSGASISTSVVLMQVKLV